MTAAPASARRHRVPLQTIRLQTSGPVSAHLLITDAKGRRIGFVRRRLVNEIPGPRIARVFVDGARTWLERIEPQYEVPTGKQYRIELTAGTPQAGLERGSAASAEATVTVLGPGFLAAVRRTAVAPGQRARLRLSADGHTMSFVRSRGRRQPLLVLGNAAPGENDYQWNIRDKRRSTGRPVPVSIDVADRTMTLWCRQLRPVDGPGREHSQRLRPPSTQTGRGRSRHPPITPTGQKANRCR
jgi:hypothetical protein